MAAAPLVLRLLISLAYLGAGIFVMIYRPFNAPVFDFPFAIACIAYGAFRAYRAIKDYQTEKEEQT